MTLAERIPEMSDADLTALHANAVRLSGGGTPHSRRAADLLPALEAEIGARKAHAAVTAPKRSRQRAKAGADAST